MRHHVPKQPSYRFTSNEEGDFLLIYGPECPLSNSFAHEFAVKMPDQTIMYFKTMEQYYQYTKCLYLNELELADEIFECDSPILAREIAQKIVNFDQDM